MKPIQNIFTSTVANISNFYNIFGDELVAYKLLPYTDSNASNYSISHAWSAMGLYGGDISYNTINTPIYNGGFLNSAFEKIPQAYHDTGAVVIAFNQNTYRTQFNGYNFAIQIPLDSSYTGMTSGLTATTLYSAFIWDVDSLNTSSAGFCAGVGADLPIAEKSVTYTNNIGIGNSFMPSNNINTDGSVVDLKVLHNGDPMNHNSGIVYLVTDPIHPIFTGATGSSLSWGYAFGESNKYQIGARMVGVTSSNTPYSDGWYDSIVGMFNLASGIIYIWDPNLVQAFNWSGFIGDPLTGATTSSGTTYAVVQDCDVQTQCTVQILSKPGDWKGTTNLSTIGQNCEDLAVTQVCLFNQNGELMAIGKLDEAKMVGADTYTPIDLTIPIGGTMLTQNRTTYPGYELGL